MHHLTVHICKDCLYEVSNSATHFFATCAVQGPGPMQKHNTHSTGSTLSHLTKQFSPQMPTDLIELI